MTSETGHTFGMPKLVMQLGILRVIFMSRVEQKIVWDSKTPTNFCPKLIVFPKKKRSLLEISPRFYTFRPKIVVLY